MSKEYNRLQNLVGSGPSSSKFVSPLSNSQLQAQPKEKRCLTKSCKCKRIIDGYEYTIIELIRNIKYYKDAEEEIKNIYYKEFFKSLKPILNGYTFEQYCETNKKFFTICDTTFSNIIKRKPQNEDKDKIPPFLCKIETKLDEAVKIAESKQLKIKWFDNTNLNIKICKIIESFPPEYQRIFKEYFLKITPQYKIMLNTILYDEIFYQEKIYEFAKLLEWKDKITASLIYDFLSTIKFAYFIVGWKNKSIYDLKKEDILMLEQIKHNIYSFIQNIFGELHFNPYNCIITIISDPGAEHFFFQFRVFDRMTLTRYNTIDEQRKYINIEDVIYNLENGVPLSYYYWSYQNTGKCKQIQPKENTIKEIFEPEFGLEEKKKSYISECLLKELISESDEIKLISSSEPLDKYHSYCSLHILIQKKSKYYKVFITSVTFDQLTKDPRFEETYLSILSSHHEYIKMGEYDTSVIMLPARVRIIIEEIKSPKISYSLNILETSEYYKNTVLPRITNDVIIKPYLILTFLYINLINKQIPIPEEIDQKFMKIPLIAFFKLGQVANSNNFVIGPKINKLCLLIDYYNINKQITKNEIICLFKEIMCLDDKLIKIDIISTIKRFEQRIIWKFSKIHPKIKNIDIINNDEVFNLFMQMLIKDTTKIYQLWYVNPDLKIINDEELSKYLDQIINYINENRPSKNDQLFKHISSLPKNAPITREYFDTFTNFYKLFSSPDTFLYNLRHLQNRHIEEIKQLLKVYLYNTIPIIHYPNLDSFNIFHLQIYPKNASSEDIVGINTNISFTRAYLLDIFANITPNYFMDKDIILTFIILDNIGLNEAQIKETRSYIKFINDFEKTRIEIIS